MSKNDNESQQLVDVDLLLSNLNPEIQEILISITLIFAVEEFLSANQSFLEELILKDYWKSQDRKYCDFCKCWIADNKPSIEFHERGRRHQENVKKRLRNISKTSAKSQRETERVDATLRQMEAAALDAYRKDVENSADLTSAAINKKLKEAASASGSTTHKVWHEMKSPDGKNYFWNTTTSETCDEPPKDGYLTLAEQEQQTKIEKSNEWKAFQKLQERQSQLRKQQDEKEEAEDKARLAREKMKERRVTESPEPEVVYGPILDPGPTNPYGKWEVVKESQPMPDLQLPKQAENFEAPVEYEPEPVVKEFREKTIDSLNIEGPSSFKKRKIGLNAKRNVRQRLDND